MTAASTTDAAICRARLEKRIRRRVQARRHVFFAVAAPGLEPLVEAQLVSLGMDVPPPVIEPGGVAFEAGIQDACKANLWLRSATRVLMRIDSFKADSFRRLEKGLRKIPWELYTRPDRELNIKVAAHHSRLFHKGAVAQRVRDMIAAHFRQTFALPGPPVLGQQLFVRLEHDRCTVSLDSSGDPLYKRGLKTGGGRAPIRETLAAAILTKVGYTGNQVVLDPMCGTGSFALEAAMMALNRPPGWYREFAFERWPGFRPGPWKDVRKQAAAGFRDIGAPLIFSSDLDPAVCQSFQRRVAQLEMQHVIQVSCGDFFEIDPQRAASQKGILILNPPYGRRIGTAGTSSALFARILDHTLSTFAGWQLALIVPPELNLPRLPRGFDSWRILHGGLRLTVLMGKAA